MKKKILVFAILFFLPLCSMAQNGWFKINNPVKGRIRGIDFISVDEGYVLGDTELYRTNDGGVSWQRINLPAPKGQTGIFHFLSGLTGLLTYSNNNIVKVFATTNGGIAWAEKPIPGITANDGFNSFSFTNPKDGYILGGTDVGFNPLISHTTDSGMTWNTWHVDVPCGGPNYVIITRLSFRTPAIGLGSFMYLYPANYCIMSTNDSGKHWIKSRPGEYATYLSNGEWICSASAGESSDTTFFYKSTDDGVTWNQVSTIYGHVWDLKFSHQTGYALIEALGSLPAIYSTSDYGNHWVKDSIPLYFSPNNYHFYFHLSVPTEKNAYAASDTAIIKTTTGGLNVKTISNSENIKILSNPILSSADFQFDALKEASVFEVFDLLGRSLLREQLPAGQTALHLDMQKYPAGIYFARLGSQTLRFIKQ